MSEEIQSIATPLAQLQHQLESQQEENIAAAERLARMGAQLHPLTEVRIHLNALTEWVLKDATEEQQYLFAIGVETLMGEQFQGALRNVTEKKIEVAR